MNYQEIIHSCRKTIEDMKLMKAEHLVVGIATEDTGEVIGTAVFIRGEKLPEFEKKYREWIEETWPTQPKGAKEIEKS